MSMSRLSVVSLDLLFFSYQSTNLVRTGKLVLFVDEGISAQKYSVFVKFIRLNELSTPIKT